MHNPCHWPLQCVDLQIFFQMNHNAHGPAPTGKGWSPVLRSARNRPFPSISGSRLQDIPRPGPHRMALLSLTHGVGTSMLPVPSVPVRATENCGVTTLPEKRADSDSSHRFSQPRDSKGQESRHFHLSCNRVGWPHERPIAAYQWTPRVVNNCTPLG